MADYIDREAAIEAVGDIHPLDYNSRAIAERLKDLPSADVAPVRRGRWIWHDVNGVAFYVKECSVCGWVHALSGNYLYCHNCGARMDGEKDE